MKSWHLRQIFTTTIEESLNNDLWRSLINITKWWSSAVNACLASSQTFVESKTSCGYCCRKLRSAARQLVKETPNSFFFFTWTLLKTKTMIVQLQLLLWSLLNKWRCRLLIQLTWSLTPLNVNFCFSPKDAGLFDVWSFSRFVTGRMWSVVRDRDWCWHARSSLLWCFVIRVMRERSSGIYSHFKSLKTRL